MRIAVGLAVVVALVITVVLLVARLGSDRPAERTAPAVAAGQSPTVATTAAEASTVSAAASPASPQQPAAAVSGTTLSPRQSAPRTDPPGRVRLTRVDGYSAVHLGGGVPTIRPFGGRDQRPTRRVRGRVVDRGGAPVAGAVVLADRGFNLVGESMMALGGATTDRDGTFTIDDAPADRCFVVALADRDWSTIGEVSGDEPVELRIVGHGALDATFTYDGEPETFSLHLKGHGLRGSGAFETGSDGKLAIASLPPGSYTARAGLAQALGGGHSALQTRDVTIVDGETTRLELAFGAGMTVSVKAIAPAGTKPRAITYWLFRGAAPRDGTDAAARDKAEGAPSMTHGGGLATEPVQFHDVEPGSYWACAAFYDPTVMGELDRPFGCARVVVAADVSVAEVSVTLAP